MACWRLPRILFALAGNFVRTRAHRAPVLSRGSVDSNNIGCRFYWRDSCRQSSRPRHYLWLLRSRQQELELQRPCGDGPIASRGVDRALGRQAQIWGNRALKPTDSGHLGWVWSHLQSNRNLPLGSYLRALRHSPLKSRIVIARKSFPYLFRRLPESTAGDCEFESVANYERSYRRLAVLVGGGEKHSPPGEVEFLHSIQNQGAHPGTISLPEFLFLTAFASVLAPKRAIEIGT